jgi:uncharacterized protein YbjT (DUF2867 family)
MIQPLGSTGKTGSRVVTPLIDRGPPVRTAARFRADVTFDWSWRDSYGPALDSVGRVYLVAPVMRLDFAEDVLEGTFAEANPKLENLTFCVHYRASL